jgi:hypothetical protein
MKHEFTNVSTLGYSEVGLFGAIGNAVNELKRESDRVASGETCIKTITTGELQKVLENARHSTRLLEQVRFAGEREQLPIPATVEAIVRTVHEVGYGKNGLNYIQAVRALTDALNCINLEQLALDESQGKGKAA